MRTHLGGTHSSAPGAASPAAHLPATRRRSRRTIAVGSSSASASLVLGQGRGPATLGHRQANGRQRLLRPCGAIIPQPKGPQVRGLPDRRARSAPRGHR
eukprot:14420585-Alexandrium_andersonii.AAC.1